jgi:hypothetical protein
MSDKRCPRCGLWNSGVAMRCDCGYDFTSGQLKGSLLGQKGHAVKRFWPALVVVGMVTGLLTSLISVFVFQFFLPQEYKNYLALGPGLGALDLMIFIFFASPGSAVGGLIGGLLVQDRGKQAQIISAAITGGVTAFALSGCCLWLTIGLSLAG